MAVAIDAAGELAEGVAMVDVESSKVGRGKINATA